MLFDFTKRLERNILNEPVKKFTRPFPLSFTTNQSVKDALRDIQTNKPDILSDLFYVTSQDGVLQGAVTLRDLLYADPSALLGDLIEQDIIKLLDDEPLEKALLLISNFQVFVLPVVNIYNQLVGIFEILPYDSSTEATSSQIEKKNLEKDIFQIIGFSLEESKFNSPWLEYRHRMPWLLCNVIGGLICAMIGQFFQKALLTFVILSLFIPLVLTLSEAVSMQSMSLSLRFLHFKTIKLSQVLRRLFVEFKTSFILGTTCALIIAGFYFAWSLVLTPIIAIGLSVVIAMVATAILGALFPILLHLMRLDPKVAAGPMILMMGDIITMTVYLGLATYFLL